MDLMKLCGATALCLSVCFLASPVHAQDAAAEPAASSGAAETTEAAESAQEAEPMLATPPGMQMPELSSEDVSYAIGLSIGTNIANELGSVYEFNLEELIQGVRAGFGEAESRMSDEQFAQTMMLFQMQLQQKMMQAAQDNMAASQAFLEANAKKEGVTVTESGLQYRVINSGDGATPTTDDMVSANYKGTLIDGTEFDSSAEGEPASFPVARVIPGWVEALQMMKVGDKWELVIPSDLGYGERGSMDGAIGPNQVLIFELELIGVEPMPEQPMMPAMP